MKKLLTSILVLSSTLSLAQEFRSITIKNLTYPEQQMKISCLDANCTSALLDGVRVFQLSTLDQTIKDRRGYRKDEKLYSLTSESASRVSKNTKEAYYGRAVGNGLVTGGALIVDTVIAVPQLLIQVLTPKIDSVSDKKAAKRVKANLLGDIDEVILKEKYYREIKNYLRSNNVSEEYDNGLQNSDYVGPIFRCQLTTGGCYENGGRYGVTVEASDYVEAINKCEAIASDRSEIFCKLTEVR